MVSFVVLHYNDFNVTCKCIEHLLQINEIEEHTIIIVDNASPNGSGIRLKKMFENNNIIDVILIAKNCGFAKGNDVGYYYAKKKGEMEYIIVMNNDVMIKDSDFINKLTRLNLCQKAEVVLPEIINKNGKQQNPYRLKPVATKDINKMLLQKIILMILYYMPFFCNILIKRNLKKQSKEELYYDPIDNYTEMLVPHGSCVIYTKKWIRNEDIAFIPDTFMYHEEDILYEYIINKKYKTIYNHDLSVIHLEDVSTSTVAKTELQF